MFDLYDLLLATSKDRQLDDIDSFSGSFGSRGEALASISDIAVLEITAKAPGKPNGYRKVLKVLITHHWIKCGTLEGCYLFPSCLLKIIIFLFVDFLVLGMQVFASWN